MGVFVLVSFFLGVLTSIFLGGLVSFFSGVFVPFFLGVFVSTFSFLTKDEADALVSGELSFLVSTIWSTTTLTRSSMSKLSSNILKIKLGSSLIFICFNLISTFFTSFMTSSELPC